MRQTAECWNARHVLRSQSSYSENQDDRLSYETSITMKQVGTQSGYGSGKLLSGQSESIRAVPNEANRSWTVPPIVRVSL